MIDQKLLWQEIVFKLQINIYLLTNKIKEQKKDDSYEEECKCQSKVFFVGFLIIYDFYLLFIIQKHNVSFP